MLGHDAWSCDLLPCENGGKHLQCDLREALKAHWDFVGFHTPCTYLANSGVGWLRKYPERWSRLDEACELFRFCLEYPVMGYMENPIPHKYALERIGRKYNQIIQPFYFGHPESKQTCLWLKGIPPLRPSHDVKAKLQARPIREQQRLHWLPPSKDRWKERSRTFPGIAQAMAEQWGHVATTKKPPQ